MKIKKFCKNCKYCFTYAGDGQPGCGKIVKEYWEYTPLGRERVKIRAKGCEFENKNNDCKYFEEPIGIKENIFHFLSIGFLNR